MIVRPVRKARLGGAGVSVIMPAFAVPVSSAKRLNGVKTIQFAPPVSGLLPLSSTVDIQKLPGADALMTAPLGYPPIKPWNVESYATGAPLACQRRSGCDPLAASLDRMRHSPAPAG